MRNLKKILALVLALVMTMSVMTVASAEFKDADKVNAKFATAVEVLNGLKVFRGYEDGTFKPTGAITRAEVAAIIYRIDTGDVADKQVKIYSDYNKFNDVKSTEWYAGYVNYCANALYIRGYDETTFGPNDPVTGYQALAMILRVVGYDKNGEFSGSAWQIETAKYANKLGITKNVDVNTLGAPATRELVAELLFRTITEVSDVRHTLLLGYEPLNEYIGEYRFGLSQFDSTHPLYGTDEWGRPSSGWLSFNKVISIKAETPLATYVEPVDQCTIVKETGVKGPVGHWVNGIEGQNVITSTHNTVNHIMGEQGTILEVYKDRVIEIDTYLARVTGTVKAAYDKNGHQYRAATNEFTLFNAPVDTVIVAGNDYNNGDFWLVNYNEANDGIYPYALPTTIEGKQTYIWWNAAKHTVEGTVYMDNANYGPEMDAAGYDKTDAYTWFFDTYGNVIGSAEIIIPAAAKNYAVVLGAQWINYVGKDGEALAKVFNLSDASVADGVKITKVDTNEVKYADTYEANFAAGAVCTTYQYNKNTEATLYEIVKAGELKAVTTDLDVVIYDGVSRIGDSQYYADNNTVFFFYEVKTDSVKTVVGYDNLAHPYGYTCQDVDVIVDEATGFAKYVYIPSYTLNKAPSGPATPDTVVSEYVYITGDAMNYKLKDQFALLGVVDGEGSTDALYFAMSFAGGEAATEAYLNNLVKFGQDMLFYVTTTNGKVTEIVPVALDAEHVTAKEGNALFVAADEFYFIGTGVMVLEDGTALNVNHNTVLINEGKVGQAINNMDYVYGNNLYIVYEGTTAKAIFVTPTAANFTVNGVEMTMADAMVLTLSANDFEDVSASFTYVVADDANIDYAVVAAAVAEAVKAGTTVAMIDSLYGDDVIAVSAVYNEATKLFDVTITTAAATNTVSIYITVIDVETVLNAAYDLEDGQALDFAATLTGEITAINTAWSEQYKNITVTIEVEGFEDMPVMCYRLAGEGAADLAVGDTITVTGIIKNYKGTIEFEQGCTLDAVVKGEGAEELTTPEEILTAAYELAAGQALPGTYTLTGVITSIDTAYSEQYNNITVTIVVDGLTEMPIQCFRLKGDGAATLAVGDTITVTGTIMNYGGTVEFNSGCTLDAVVKA